MCYLRLGELVSSDLYPRLLRVLKEDYPEITREQGLPDKFLQTVGAVSEFITEFYHCPLSIVQFSGIYTLLAVLFYALKLRVLFFLVTNITFPVFSCYSPASKFHKGTFHNLKGDFGYKINFSHVVRYTVLYMYLLVHP